MCCSISACSLFTASFSASALPVRVWPALLTRISNHPPHRPPTMVLTYPASRRASPATQGVRADDLDPAPPVPEVRLPHGPPAAPLRCPRHVTRHHGHLPAEVQARGTRQARSGRVEGPAWSKNALQEAVSAVDELSADVAQPRLGSGRLWGSNNLRCRVLRTFHRAVSSGVRRLSRHSILDPPLKFPKFVFVNTLLDADMKIGRHGYCDFHGTRCGKRWEVQGHQARNRCKTGTTGIDVGSKLIGEDLQ
jgi:hypothetical protein